MNYWSTARKGVLALDAASVVFAVVKKNPAAPLALLGMHAAEYLLVARKAGKKVWEDDTRCLVKTLLYGFTYWVPLKLEIE